MDETNYKPFPFALLRAPLQSLKHAYTPSGVISPLFLEGVYLSSREFWQESQKAGFFSGDEKMRKGFFKYWLRSCSRCTPFGTFAGSAMINISDEGTSLIIGEERRHSRHLRVDMNYIANLILAVTKMPVILEQIKFFVNNSLYELPDSLRYAEYVIRDNTRHYQLASVEKTDYIMAILEQARRGATIGEFGATVMSSQDVDEEEARSLILSMWQSQLLISELEPCVTGKEPLARLIEQLSALRGTGDLAGRLLNIQDLLQHPGEGAGFYQSIEKEIEAIGVIPDRSGNALQADLYLFMKDDRIGKSLIDCITGQAVGLLALARQHKNPDLEGFKARFQARYEDAEIPLDMALDADMGIGYSGVTDDAAGRGELINDLALGLPGKERQGDFDYITEFVLHKYQDFLQARKEGIEITEEELTGHRKHTDKYLFPNSMFLMGNLLKKNGKLDEEEFIFDLSVFGGPSAANLLGRFTHGDENLCQATREILKQEEEKYDDGIYAEIVHLPQARTGNVLLRPVLRKYEIPYVGRSGAIAEDQITVDDLTISVRHDEIVLHSKRLRRRIIPRLTTAHNFSFDSLPVYKFLCDLQGQGLSFPNVWDWGHLEVLKHLPRVSYKNIILKKARWKIGEDDAKDLAGFCRKRNIPSRVVYKEGDNGLLIDLRQESGVALLLHYLKRYKSVILEEALFDEENCIISDTLGAPYHSEIIIPLYKTPPGIMRYPDVWRPDAEPFIKKKFPPGSEWAYFKIYCGVKTAEKILIEAVLPFVERGIGDGLFEYFHFVRYRDEFPHLRIRFYNADQARQAAVQSKFMLAMQPYMDNGYVHRIGMDTYSRELQRYGPGQILETEKLFHNDSLAVLRFIALLEEEGEYRLLFALRGIDMLLSDFAFSCGEKAGLLKQIQSAFFKEFGGGLPLQKQLNEKYRKYQQRICLHMDPSLDRENEIGDGVAIFTLRSEMNAGIVPSILSRHGARQELFDLLASYIHMYMNRLFIAQQRKYELVVYHFLEKYYTSQLAIEKKRMQGAKLQP